MRFESARRGNFAKTNLKFYIMKKILLMITVFVATLSGATAQTKFAITPEVAFGFSQLPKKVTYDGEKKDAAHLSLGFSMGAKVGTETSNFIGGYLGLDGYGYTLNEYQEEYGHITKNAEASAGAFTLGITEFTRFKCGFTVGGMLGCKIWGKEISVEKDRYKLDKPGTDLVFKARAGYGFKHALLLTEVGYDAGLSAGFAFAFPIYRTR